MYALILTLFLQGYTANVTGVTGFTSRETCMAAANVWLEQQRELHRSSVYTVSARAACVRQ